MDQTGTSGAGERWSEGREGEEEGERERRQNICPPPPPPPPPSPLLQATVPAFQETELRRRISKLKHLHVQVRHPIIGTK